MAELGGDNGAQPAGYEIEDKYEGGYTLLNPWDSALRIVAPQNNGMLGVDEGPVREVLLTDEVQDSAMRSVRERRTSHGRANLQIELGDNDAAKGQREYGKWGEQPEYLVSRLDVGPGQLSSDNGAGVAYRRRAPPRQTLEVVEAVPTVLATVGASAIAVLLCPCAEQTGCFCSIGSAMACVAGNGPLGLRTTVDPCRPRHLQSTYAVRRRGKG